MTVDLHLIDDLDRPQPREPRDPAQAFGREAPIDEVIAGVDVSGAVDLDRGSVVVERRAVGLEDDLAAGLEHAGQGAEDGDRVADPVQHPEAEHHVEALAELADGERVELAVVDLRVEQPVDGVEARRGRDLEPEASADPIDVLLIVDRDDAAGAARLGEERVEAVEAPDVQDAAALEAIDAEHLRAVPVVAGESGRVDAGRQGEGVKPDRHGVACAFGDIRRRVDGQQVRDGPLGGGRLGDQLEQFF